MLHHVPPSDIARRDNCLRNVGMVIGNWLPLLGSCIHNRGGRVGGFVDRAGAAPLPAPARVERVDDDTSLWVTIAPQISLRVTDDSPWALSGPS